MNPHDTQDGVVLYLGDCREVMATLPEASVDAVICDPPYGLEFMGKKWDSFKPTVGDGFRRITEQDEARAAEQDGLTLRRKKAPEAYVAGKAFQDWCQTWATEALRVLKPGGYLLAFGGTRTYHRMVTGVEDAGFEIRDQVQWLYGSGFPKSHNVSKAIDNAAGAERKVVGVDPSRAARLVNQTGDYTTDTGWSAGNRSADITEPATDDAKRWEGFGTALKPAHEPIVIARKPFKGTIANNVLTHGTGVLNIDACRVPTEESTARPDGKWKHGSDPHSPSLGSSWNAEGYTSGGSPLGRWPANVIHDGSEEVAKGLGHAARFFFCPKTSKKEKGAGNDHPTVKPQTLLQYLCRLVTPPGGTILDPFTGSGSMLLAARAEGFSIIGIEQDEHYCDIAVSRLGEPQGRPAAA